MEVVKGIIQGLQLGLASVARPGVDVTDMEAAVEFTRNSSALMGVACVRTPYKIVPIPNTEGPIM
jgi:hypothetical protein